MPELNQRPKVTIEDLLQLKRAERPEPEFWAKFERELRQKQLTALIEKRPWWQELPQLLTRRAYLPVGATAILAFTLVSLKYYTPTPTSQAEPAGVSVANEKAFPVAPVSSPLLNRSEAVAVSPDVQVAAVSARSSAEADEVVELMPLLVAPAEAETPSARLLASNLSRMEVADADFARGLSAHSREREQVSSVATEEMASIPTSSAKRNRLLASYAGRQVNGELSAPSSAIARDRMVRRLGDPEPERPSRLVREMDSFSTPLPQIVALRF